MIKNKIFPIIASLTLTLGVVGASVIPSKTTQVVNKTLLTAPDTNNTGSTNTSSTVNYNTVNYNTTLSNYVSQELQNHISNTGEGGQTVQNELFNAINPSLVSNKFEFLDVNTYRNVNEAGLNKALQGVGVFSGEANAFISAAKKYNIDPLYLVAKSALETGFGTTQYAKGITITQIANTNAPIYNSNGELTGYQMINLPNPVTVYNLFGIGAYDASASFPNKTEILGTTYAYNHGWTSIPSAIDGAAQFLSQNYLHNATSPQITPYEIRFNPNLNEIWHQYATDITYPNQIANIMQKYSNLYDANDTFTYTTPVFQ